MYINNRRSQSRSKIVKPRFALPLKVLGCGAIASFSFFVVGKMKSQPAVALSPSIVEFPRAVPTPIIASSAPSNILPAVQKTEPGEVLKMVMVDQTQLSSSQRTVFQQYIQTAGLPATKVGKRCQYYGKPDVWCLVLDDTIAKQVYQKLSLQPFASAMSIKSVRRLRAPEKN